MFESVRSPIRFRKMTYLLLVLSAAILAITQVSAVSIGDACTNSTYCNYEGTDAVPNSKCTDGTCQCTSTYYGETGDTKCVQASLGDDCSAAADNSTFCLTAALNSNCTLVGGDEICECDSGFYKTKDIKTGRDYCADVGIGTKCNPGNEGDAFCRTTIPNAQCSSFTKTCQCLAKRVYVPDAGYCVAASYEAGCATCRRTGGYCYDLENDGSPSGCACSMQRGSSGATAAETLTKGCDTGKAELGEYCNTDGTVTCRAANSVCVHAGGISQRSECTCKPGYVALRATNKNTVECYRTLGALTDPNCKTCTDNAGICYDLDGDKIRDGCVCPDSRTSSDPHNPSKDCDENHVTVECASNTMTLCYVPHNTTRFPNMAPRLDATKSYVYIKSRLGKDPCVMERAAGSDEWCVDLSLDEKKSTECGTVTSYPTHSVIYYQNWMVLQAKSRGRGADDVVFHGYCQYDTVVHAFTASGTEVVELAPIASEGKEVHPELEMKVYDEFRRDATKQGIRLGQPAMLEIAMTDDKNVYNSIRPEVCIATNRPELANPATESILLLFNGCPVEHSYLDLTNMFYPDPADPEISRTGLFPMFQFEGGDFVFFHCAVRVCRVLENCQPANCSTSRKRRALEAETFTDELTYFATGHNTYITSRARRAAGGRSTSLEPTRSEPVKITGDAQGVAGGDLAQNDGNNAVATEVKQSPTTMIGIGGGVLALLVVVAVVVGWRIRRSRSVDNVDNPVL